MRSQTRRASKWITVGMAAIMLLTPTWANANPAMPATQMPQVNPGTMTTPAEIKEFTDVHGHFSEKAVQHLNELQLINGSGNQLFHPNETITRQDFALLLSKIVGLQAGGESALSFADVSTNSPYVPYLSSLIDAGIMKGKGDRLEVKAPLSRQDMAVILSRVMDATANQPSGTGAAPKPYIDEKSVASYAQDAVYTVGQKGWLLGSNGMFYPIRNVTRGEAAVVMDRIWQARLEQAQQVEIEANHHHLKLIAGTSEQLVITRKGGGKLPFTPIFSLDNPDIGAIEPDGTFVAGTKTGLGQVTVTVGYQTLQIPVEVTADGSPNPTTGSASTTSVSGSSSADSAVTVPSGTDTSATTKPETSESNANHTDLVNYAPGSFSSVAFTGPQDAFFGNMEKKYPGPVGGIVTPSETWTGYNRQFGREITVTLPEKKNVQQISLQFKQDQGAGIELPKSMEVEVSQDGKRWSYAGKVTHAVSPGDKTSLIRSLTVQLPSTELQSVRVRFPVKVWVFARQLQVLGNNQAAPSLVLLPPTRVENGGMAEDIKAEDRMRNLLLAYSGANGERGTWTVDNFLPLVGYINQDGKMADQLFDSVLFLPYPTMTATKDSWNKYLNDLFQQGRQLDALNTAMLEYNKQRGTLVNHRTIEKVVLTLPYPDPNQANFGQVLEDQDPLSFQASKVGGERAYQYRLQAMNWYFNELMKRWNAADYSYLKLEGIYWFHELVDDASPRERDIIWEAAEMVHQKALRFYWIPYYGAPGFTEWKQLGFDYAFVQPNFYFTDVSTERIESTLSVANQYGMGIEVEGDEKMVRDLKFFQTYYNQLIAGHKLGIDKNKIHAYYYGSKSLLEAYSSKDEHFRAVYDDTYKWMNGKFTISDYMKPIAPQIP
ncbi:DUF4855 domain-containing protein [Brevibacillus ginsengisoli]|uniref:DUF4855 domain-containing protein n=1 Tax=Brevibacillus ginsengisoli TaxID=363854 RepID=UPI003CF4DE8B